MRAEHKIRGMLTEEATRWIEIEITQGEWERARRLAEAWGIEPGEAVSALVYAACQKLEIEEQRPMHLNS